MGFSQTPIEIALWRSFGNIERAAEMLLMGAVEPLADPANRHRMLLASDNGTFEFVMRDVLQHLGPELREVVMNDPGILLRELGLDPGAFDCDGVRQRIQHAPQRDEAQERMQQFYARRDEREQVINRLMTVGGGLGRDIVIAVLDGVRGDEEAAVEALLRLVNAD
jgi:hypothetical protein